ncbi:dynein light chain Tctex-type protein 2 isoform X2 [Bemisia tabaci]|uniref:dynein light chain Tctex-type protein 2 isoform X2 n=1 Tax=Bemisia tabaci TaxID=7038 RepID=UPI0008F9BFCF|nr:PREDICTED: tctex1 domain-containing protein 1-B-like isoform X2 [Bemisia tabaci]XP_018910820.1 PREDICTED: tctex1 domain-containing protein 1-B-like isoform X2 [Bemisia tabaci]
MNPANQVLKYANSYQLESKNKFCPEKVERILHEVVAESVTVDTRYDAVESPKMALKLSADLRERVKDLQFDRYKLVCVIQISEKAGQGLLTLSQALWDENRDSYALFTFENYHLTISAAVYALYCE